MNDQNRRSALQVMADAARKIKAAARIVRAALSSGLHEVRPSPPQRGFANDREVWHWLCHCRRCSPDVCDLRDAEYVFRL